MLRGCHACSPSRHWSWAQSQALWTNGSWAHKAAAKEAAALLTGGSSHCRHCRVPGPAGHWPAPDLQCSPCWLPTAACPALITGQPSFSWGQRAPQLVALAPSTGQACWQVASRTGGHPGRDPGPDYRRVARWPCYGHVASLCPWRGGASRDSPSARGLRGDRPPVAAQSPSFPPGKFKLSTLQ